MKYTFQICSITLSFFNKKVNCKKDGLTFWHCFRQVLTDFQKMPFYSPYSPILLESSISKCLHDTIKLKQT